MMRPAKALQTTFIFPYLHPEDLLLFKRKLSTQLVKKELKNLDCFSALELDKGYTGGNTDFFEFHDKEWCPFSKSKAVSTEA